MIVMLAIAAFHVRVMREYERLAHADALKRRRRPLLAVLPHLFRLLPLQISLLNVDLKHPAILGSFLT